MWIALFAASWVIGSVALYSYLVASAKEPKNEACADCRLSECSECPHLQTTETELKHAA